MRKFIALTGALVLVAVLAAVYGDWRLSHRLPVKNQYVEVEPRVSDIDTVELLSLTNRDRMSNEAKPLVRNPLLDKSALDKCNDMVARNYWDHQTPDGKEPWTFIDAEGIKYHKVGENLAAGSVNAHTTENAWLASPGHRANLLDPEFTEVGFGVCYSPAYVGTNGYSALIVVEHFDKP